MFWKKTSFDRKHLNQPFDNKSWCQKKIKLNLMLTNPELFFIYWTCHHHLFWFRFLKLVLIFYCQSSWREISILKKVFNYAGGFLNRIVRLKFDFFSNFILIFNLKKLKKKNIYYFNKLSFKLLLTKKKKTIYLSISLTTIPHRGFHVYMI